MNLTQLQAAERAGTSRQVISQIENGKYDGALYALLNYLAVVKLRLSVSDYGKEPWEDLMDLEELSREE